MTGFIFSNGYRSARGLSRCLVIVIVALAGCAPQTVTAPNPIEIDRGEYTRIYTAAVQVLREQGFRIDHHSHRFGKVTTHYQPAPTVFEPWLTRTTTSEQAWTNSLNEQRRVVVVLLEPSGTDRNEQPIPHPNASSDYQMRVHVMIERQQLPNRFLTGSTDGHAVFGSLLSTPTELREKGISEAYWQPLGRDTHLEQFLIAKIVRRSLEIQDLHTDTNPASSDPS